VLLGHDLIATVHHTESLLMRSLHVCGVLGHDMHDILIPDTVARLQVPGSLNISFFFILADKVPQLSACPSPSCATLYFYVSSSPHATFPPFPLQTITPSPTPCTTTLFECKLVHHIAFSRWLLPVTALTKAMPCHGINLTTTCMTKTM
jgi:hypothetical protein